MVPLNFGVFRFTSLRILLLLLLLLLLLFFFFFFILFLFFFNFSKPSMFFLQFLVCINGGTEMVTIMHLINRWKENKKFT
jgi:hypothetical protein